MATKLWPTASIMGLLISYRLFVHHMLLPTGHQAVAHSLNYLGTTALLPGFCASYAVALWPPSCGPQPQFGYYCSHWASYTVALWPTSCGPLPQFGDYCSPTGFLCIICYCPLATKLWPTASIRGLLISYRLFEHHMLLPTGHPAVAHSLNYLGTTALLPGFCASYNVALWPPSCGPQPQLGDY